MSEQAEVENWVTEQFAELSGYGFSGPVVRRDDWSSVIGWFGLDIAIELELDWRELEIFVLIVRLDDGQLPQGYYIANGKPCRFHLQRVVKEKGWFHASDEMELISTIGKRESSRKPSMENLKKRVLAYKAVLISCMDQLLAEGRAVFTA